MTSQRRLKSWRAVVVGFVAVTLGGFFNNGWSEDLPPPQAPAAISAPAAVTPGVDQRLDQLDQQVKALQDQVQANKEAHTERLTPPGQTTSGQNPPAGEATAGRSGFALQSDDGNFLLRLQGLIQADGRFYSGSGANSRNYSAATAGTILPSQFLLRRVRPIFSGTIFHNYDFLIQPDFGGGTTVIYDAYLDIKPFSVANLRIGKFKNPLGLERLQTDSYLTFAERSLTSDLTPQRDTGLELYGSFFGNSLTYQASFTNGNLDASASPDSDTNNAKEGALRLFAQPLKTTPIVPLQGLGIGIAGSYTADGAANPGATTSVLGFKTAAGQETFFSYTNGVAFNGQHSHLIPQANYYWGPLGVYGEYAQSNQVAQSGRLRTRLSDNAWQAAAFWVLTGENASYTGVTPSKNFDPAAGTWGAWEIATRIQQLQVDPDTFALRLANPSTSASRATAYTIGVNWYLNRFVKFVADYEETWFKGGAGTLTNVGDRPIERLVDTRWQLAF